VRYISDLHWVWSTVFLVLQGKAQAVVVVIWCSYKFFSKPLVVQ
jgi:hypothetical protein